ncbi:hypothetical protein OMO38_08830 [Chryseobacterium sp. 09-1422]|uniref:DUF4274 domain-containing protein n=1 Tax=Chryseobacterium kimseyorum TaxID=2984028 RepID=A0ABT3HXU2_9FLAO|nr:hypothetical protein [Chryseobacterium kimseyorum]MCW3168631.1 hypothetical protein [Chryseobacterium kimseyorum]
MGYIETKIDEAFTNTFLLPREKAVTDFLVDVLNSKYQFRNDDRKVEVISIYYYAANPLAFIFALPNYEYYAPDKTIQIAELHLKDHLLEDYSSIDVENLCKKILNENSIDYAAYLDQENRLDFVNYWENQRGLEIDFLKNCWIKAKENTRSKVIGFLESSDNSAGILDLDNGFELPFEIEIDEYLKSRGFLIDKEI